MKTQTFNGSAMPIVNEKWVAKVLGMEHNLGKGPDVMDDKKSIEVKFRLIKPTKNRANYSIIWTVQEHQLEYDEIFNSCFWGLGLYELDRPVGKVRTYDMQELEEMVLQREFYVIKWSWMNQYPPHICRGEKNGKRWENIFRYPKFKDVPSTTQTIKVEKGLVHLTKGVPDYLF